MAFFSEALDNEFTFEQVELLYKIAYPTIERMTHRHSFDLSMYDFLALKLSELNCKKNIKHRYSYLKKLVELGM